MSLLFIEALLQISDTQKTIYRSPIHRITSIELLFLEDIMQSLYCRRLTLDLLYIADLLYVSYTQKIFYRAHIQRGHSLGHREDILQVSYTQRIFYKAPFIGLLYIEGFLKVSYSKKTVIRYRRRPSIGALFIEDLLQVSYVDLLQDR